MSTAENGSSLLEKCTNPDPDVADDKPHTQEDFTTDFFDVKSSLYYVDLTLPMPCRPSTEENVPSTEWEEDGNGREYFSYLLGRNALSILEELQPESTYTMISQSERKRFIMSVSVGKQSFRGTGSNKKLAKARAAREAIKALYHMECGNSEDGLPVYECNENEWLDFKDQLKEKYKSKSDDQYHIKHPIQLIHEYYPKPVFTFVETEMKPDIRNFSICHLLLEDETFEGVGLSKKLAKINAAEIALESLARNGVLEKKDKELEAKKLKEKKRQETDNLEFPPKSINGKFHQYFPTADFHLIAELPFTRHITAFIIRLMANGKSFTGVGKSKKSAKSDAIEMTLKSFGFWMTTDDKMKSEFYSDDDDEIFNRLDVTSRKERKKWNDESGISCNENTGNVWTNDSRWQQSIYGYDYDDGYNDYSDICGNGYGDCYRSWNKEYEKRANYAPGLYGWNDYEGGFVGGRNWDHSGCRGGYGGKYMRRNYGNEYWERFGGGYVKTHDGGYVHDNIEYEGGYSESTLEPMLEELNLLMRNINFLSANEYRKTPSNFPSYHDDSSYEKSGRGIVRSQTSKRNASDRSILLQQRNEEEFGHLSQTSVRCLRGRGAITNISNQSRRF